MVQDEALTLSEAAAFLKLSQRKTSSLIKSGELVGRQTGGNSGKYLTLKSACLDYLRSPAQNHPASMGDKKEGYSPCQSPSGAEYGTVISLPRQAKELGDRCSQRTRSKPRSCMTS